MVHYGPYCKSAFNAVQNDLGPCLTLWASIYAYPYTSIRPEIESEVSIRSGTAQS